MATEILLIEDNPGDVRLVREFLAETSPGQFGLETAGRLSSGMEWLSKEPFDVVLLDLGLPDSQGLSTFLKLKSEAPLVPVIVLTGLKDEEMALKAVQAGAQDYLFKGQLDGNLLARVIRYAIERNKVEKEIRRLLDKETQSAKEWQETFDAITDIVNVISPSHEMLKINKAGVEAIGKSLEGLVGKKCYEVIHGLSAPIKDCPCVEALKIKKHITSEVTEQGRHYLLTAYPNFDERGEIVAFTHIVKDITARKKLETALKESEAKYSALVEHGNDGIIIIQDGMLTYANARVVEITGFPLEETLGKPFIDYIAPEDRNMVLDRYRKRLAGENIPARYEFNLLSKSGEKIPMEVSASIIEYKGKLADMAIVRDITERKKAEEALRQSEEFNSSLLENSPNPIHVSNPDSSIKYVNPALERLTGFTKDELIGRKTPYPWWHEDKLEEYDTNYKRILAEENAFRQEKLFKKRNGEVLWVEVNYAVIKSDGKTRYCLTNWVDITKRKKAEERVAYLNSMIWALRGINQLITREKDRELLLQKSCNLLLDSRGFFFIWILLFDDKKKYMYAAAAGSREIQETYLNNLKQGNYPPCVAGILERKESLATCADIVKKGTGCIPGDFLSNGTSLISRLEYEGKIFGVISGYVPSGMVCDQEELSMFQELAGDISFALYSCEREEQRKKAEETLQKSEEKFSKAFQMSPNIIAIANPNDGRLIDVNETWVRTHGYSREEAIGRTTIELGLWSRLADRETCMAELREKGRVQDFDARFIAKSKEITVLMSGEFIEIHGEKCVLWEFHDITERKRAEEALKQSEEKHRMLFATMAQGAVYQNAGGHIISANPSAERILGLTFDQMLGRTSIDPRWKAIHEDGSDFPGDTHPAMVALKTGQNAKDVVMGVFHLVEGKYHWILITAIPQFKTGENKPYMVYTTFTDITERKKLQEHLIIQDRLASIGQLASGIAHELNNPLTGVIGLSEMLLERDLPEDIKEDLKLINSEAQRTARVVKGLLAFARKQGSEKEPLDINSVIQTTLQIRSYEQKVSNIEVNTRFDPLLPNIMGNNGQLQQVFMNLIINAEQAMLETHHRGTLTVTTEQIGDIVRVSFTDDGPGIRPENMKQLFTPFFTTKGVGKGTGLGLSICHGIITEHGGKIYAESEFGKGATFIMELPDRQLAEGEV